jgi:hypothetical protein
MKSKKDNMENHLEIVTLLEAFRDGYLARDCSKLDSFMELFIPEAEIIGTNGTVPGQDEWYTDRKTARELVKGDWEYWGDLRFDPQKARIDSQGDVGWISISATVTKRIGEENYQSYLEYVKGYIDRPNITAQQKLLNILRGGTNTVFELNRGEKFVWPLRITAVVVKRNGFWRFSQMCFSFSTIYFPDVRVFES